LNFLNFIILLKVFSSSEETLTIFKNLRGHCPY